VDPVEERTFQLRKEAERTASGTETIVIWAVALILVSATIVFSLFYAAGR
jgi:hypothetical protein